jgi:hypothetical protein
MMQATFSINSVAHVVGRPTWWRYDNKWPISSMARARLVDTLRTASTASISRAVERDGLAVAPSDPGRSDR